MQVVRCGSTRLNTNSVDYIWTIEDFPLLRILAIQRALPNHDRITSQKFGDQHNGTWYLTLFPAGVNCDGKLLSIYLFSYSEKIRVAQFEISLLDDKLNIIEGSTVSLSQPRVFNDSDSSWGWEDYMKVDKIDYDELDHEVDKASCSNRTIPPPFENIESRSTVGEFTHFSEGELNTYNVGRNNLNDECSVYGLDDPLSWENTILKYFVFGGAIRVRIKIKSYTEVIHSDGSVIVPGLFSDRAVTQDYLWLANDISKFSIDSSFTPCEKVAINCGNELFHVPKFTLAARSNYFRKFFLSNFSDSKTQSLSVPTDDASPYILRNALDYISTGSCELLGSEKVNNWQDIIELFKFSDKYGIISLYNACIPVIIANINVKSVWSIMIIAKQCNSDVILKSVEDFFKRNDNFPLVASTLISQMIEFRHSKDNK
ncbi:POZ domain protein that is fused to a MATH domain at its N-terminus [Cryptosporidium canis]|uniref:POZ domain protein that is fused to a MATH domain at its N-terminus n=1 Tax=Cryptosporidium canis TaxID=195482 RepID=A0ABQ8PAP0_9CRYT|nr:POZ domain protein that is fused to a MATH domain at its N-terminus [Cryptosporidium canis]KAJ1613921.1 POZ domain protein that is fused to a MATH domain at its N-terminus [Cryptosporidium canis]